MALLWLEGFENDFGNSTTFLRKYPGGTYNGTNVGRWAGLSGQNENIFKTPNLGNRNNLYVGLDMRNILNIAGFGTWWTLIQVMDGNNEQIRVEFTVDSSSRIQFRIKRGSTVMGTTTNTWNFGYWLRLEFYCLLDTTGSDGTVELKVNGTSQLFIDHTQTRAQASLIWNQVQFNWSNGNNLLWGGDNLYVLDNSGGANNTYLGECHIAGVSPNGNGNRNQWDTGPTQGQPNHYTYVNELNIDDDATFLQVLTTSDGLVELFTWTALGAPIRDTLYGMLLEYDLRMDTGGDLFFTPWFRNGSATEVGGTKVHQTTFSDYVRYFELYENDPTISSAWTVSNWNSMQVGGKETTS